MRAAAQQAIAPPVASHRRRLGKIFAPYALISPGGLWLAVFFLVPIVFMASVSLQTGDIYSGFRLTWHFANFSQAVSLYHTQFLRSIWFAAVATAATLVV